MLEEQEISETIFVEENNIKYSLNLNAVGQFITFSVNYDSGNYTKKILLKEIKDKESIAVFLQYSPKVFFDFLKKLSEMNNISLVKKDNIINLNFPAEIMLKKHEKEIELIIKDKNIELIEKELKELKIKYNKINEEKKKKKKKIENLENEIKEIKKALNPGLNINQLKIDNKSVIMNENEVDFIHLAIKERLNKEVKGLKKLYQATIDGDSASVFHNKCDKATKTLVLIKSGNDKRFGEYTSYCWEGNSIEKKDENALVFSLNKMKIYDIISGEDAIGCFPKYGPIFLGC